MLRGDNGMALRFEFEEDWMLGVWFADRQMRRWVRRLTWMMPGIEEVYSKRSLFQEKFVPS